MGFNQVHESDHCVTGFGRDKPQKLYLTGHVARRRCEEDETCLWDTELPGFGLRRYITGRKSWFLRYVERGVARNWTIGDVKRVSAEDARERARKRLKEVALRGLPTRPKRSKIAAKVATFTELVEQYFEDRPFAWKPSTEKTNVHSIHKVLVPAFGTMQVAAIRKHDVLRWRDEMSDRPGAFNRDVALLSGVMQYAERLGLRKLGSNPARGVPRYAREPLQRFLNAAEFKRLHRRLAECDDIYMVAAIRLLIHTGARSSEVATLTWGEISDSRLELKDSKTGPKSILLSRQAKAILDGLLRGADDELVFTGTKGQTANLSYFWSKFRNKAGLPDVRLHDLRHSYASIAIQNGISLDAIGRLLGHALTETTERYAHLSDDCIANAAEKLGGSIVKLMGCQNVSS